jgi:hypothetical protein
VTRSTANGLAGGGALLAIFSLMLPWYTLHAGGLSGAGKSGAETLGRTSLVLAVLALAAGWSATGRAHRLLPPLAAGALALFVALKVLSPPAPAEAFGSASSGNDLQSRLTESFENALSSQLGLHYAPTWGLWLAAIGAVAALAGTIAASRD